MATTEQVYDSIAFVASQEAALAQLSPNPDTTAQLRADLNSGSKVSVWRLFAWLFAYASKVQHDLWDRYREDVLELAANGHYGTRRWFVAKALAFQYGDTLVMTEMDGGYAADNPSARIITHAAVTEQANRVVVKVAKAAGAALAKLDPPELLAANDYFQALRPPVQVIVLTADPDRLRLTGSVVYDAQTPLLATKSAVQQAIADYLMRLEFGGVMRITDLKQAMLSVPGVIDVDLTLVEARGIGPFNAVSRVYYSYAGHMVTDPSFPITSTMQWQTGSV